MDRLKAIALGRLKAIARRLPHVWRYESWSYEPGPGEITFNYKCRLWPCDYWTTRNGNGPEGPREAIKRRPHAGTA